MQKKLIIIGAGSVGGHIASNLLDYSTDYKLLGFLDDDSNKLDTLFVNYPVLGKIDTITSYSSEIYIIVGIAFPLIKSQIIEKLKGLGYYNFPSFISKASWVSKNVKIGEGCIIYPGTSINFNTNIGDFVVFNMNCAIGHDCKIGSSISFAPSVSLGGKTSIGDNTEMGIGSQSLQGIYIGAHAKVGAGAVIINNVPKNTVVVGNPARIIKENI